MKSRFLLILSVVFILASLVIGMAVPVSAANGAHIDKTNTPNDPPTSYTAAITITNLNSSDTITITLITDTIMHTVGLPETSPNLLSSPVTIPAGGYVTVTYVWNVRTGEEGTKIVDTANVTGTNNFTLDGVVYPLPFSLSYPYLTYIPLPELPAAALFGLGIVGLGGFVLIRSRKSATKAV